MAPKKFKINKVDIYLILSIVLMLAYTVTSLIILVKTGMTDNQLTICFFSAFGTELLCSCVIKSFNIKSEKIDPNPINSNGGGVG